MNEFLAPQKGNTAATDANPVLNKWNEKEKLNWLLFYRSLLSPKVAKQTKLKKNWYTK